MSRDTWLGYLVALLTNTEKRLLIRSAPTSHRWCTGGDKIPMVASLTVLGKLSELKSGCLNNHKKKLKVAQASSFREVVSIEG